MLLRSFLSISCMAISHCICWHVSDIAQASGTSLWWHHRVEWITKASSIFSVSWCKQRCHTFGHPLWKSADAEVFVCVFCGV